MGTIDISELARRTGVAASTLRYYEERGLIASIDRRGLRRVFDTRVLEQLALIALGRTAGFTLDEIAGMVVRDGRPRIDRRVLSRKAAELEATIRRLDAVRTALEHAAACPAPSHLECPTFRRLLEEASARQRATRPVKRRMGRPA
jgi:DNA-binding transcriptional MerR regulator